MTAFIYFLEGFASASALIAAILGFLGLHANRTQYAVLAYLSQCDAALRDPQFASPELGKMDLREKSFNGEKTEFERYEWFVARLVYVLDSCMRQAPFQQWGAVARTQLSSHKHYFSSEHYARQGYLAHYSPRMRRMIRQQGAH